MHFPSTSTIILLSASLISLSPTSAERPPFLPHQARHLVSRDAYPAPWSKHEQRAVHARDAYAYHLQRALHAREALLESEVLDGLSARAALAEPARAAPPKLPASAMQHPAPAAKPKPNPNFDAKAYHQAMADHHATGQIKGTEAGHGPPNPASVPHGPSDKHYPVKTDTGTMKGNRYDSQFGAEIGRASKPATPGSPPLQHQPSGGSSGSSGGFHYGAGNESPQPCPQGSQCKNPIHH